MTVLKRRHDLHHRTYRATLITALAVALAVPVVVQSQQTVQSQWPNFHGPNSNPVSDSPNLPQSWPKTENVEWAVDLTGVGGRRWSCGASACA